MYKNKKTGIVGIVITIIILIIIVVLSNTDLNKISHIENIFSSIVMPIQNGLTYLKNKIEGNDSFFTDVKNLQAENDELKKKNPDTVGWIKVDNTNINYPYVQTTDNSFYLNHSFDKSYNEAGWVFLDYRNNNNLDNNDNDVLSLLSGTVILHMLTLLILLCTIIGSTF